MTALLTEALSVRAGTIAARALASIGRDATDATLSDAAALTESQLRAAGAGRAALREIVVALRDAGLALAPDQEPRAVNGVWIVRGITTRGDWYAVSLECEHSRVTLPVAEVPRMRVGQRVRVDLRGVR